MTKRFFTTLANDEYTLIQKKGNPRSTYLKYNEVVDLLNEQQATIKKLQDLCGESDGENAKLRMENKRLQEENEQLKQELAELLAVHTKIVETLDSEFVSKALEDGD